MPALGSVGEVTGVDPSITIKSESGSRAERATLTMKIIIRSIEPSPKDAQTISFQLETTPEKDGYSPLGTPPDCSSRW